MLYVSGLIRIGLYVHTKVFYPIFVSYILTEVTPIGI